MGKRFASRTSVSRGRRHLTSSSYCTSLSSRSVIIFSAARGSRRIARSMKIFGTFVTECKVTKVPKIFMERAIRREPRAALKMMTLLELRLVQYEELVKCLLPRETEVRLANLLPILAHKFGERDEGGRSITIDLRLTHQDLAAMVASTRESVTKVLNEMRNRGVVEVEGGRITLKDYGA